MDTCTYTFGHTHMFITTLRKYFFSLSLNIKWYSHASSGYRTLLHIIILCFTLCMQQTIRNCKKYNHFQCNGLWCCWRWPLRWFSSKVPLSKLVHSFIYLIPLSKFASCYIYLEIEGFFNMQYKVFLKAWGDVCSMNNGTAMLKVPYGRTFMLNPLKFSGPCNSSSVHFQVKLCTTYIWW